MTNKRIADITLYAAIALYLLSLTQESYCTQSCVKAITALLLGWVGMLVEFGNLISAVMEAVLGNDFTLRNPVGATFTWLANPLWFLALLALKRDARVALRLSLVSTALILCFLLFESVLNNEAGGYDAISARGRGYWLWLSSSVIVLAGSSLLSRRSQELKQQKTAEVVTAKDPYRK